MFSIHDGHCWLTYAYLHSCPSSCQLNPCLPMLQADKHHILAAVISCSPTAQGGRYVQRHLHRELQHQLKQKGGNAQAALPATLSALDEAFRDMHPFNGHVLEGVKLTVAYTDAKSNVRLTPPESNTCMSEQTCMATSQRSLERTFRGCIESRCEACRACQAHQWRLARFGVSTAKLKCS